MASTGGGGDEEERDKGLPGLQQTAIIINFLQILGAYLDGFRWQLVGSVGGPVEGKEDLGVSVKNLGEGGGRGGGQGCRGYSKAMVQAVLLWGEETWVMTPCMSRPLGGSNTG